MSAGFGTVAACNEVPCFHFHSGVVSASSSVPPRTTSEEPRNLRRWEFISLRLPFRDYAARKTYRGTIGGTTLCDRYCGSSARNPRKWMRHDAHAFLDRENAVDRNVGQLVDLAAGPSNLQRFDLVALSEAKVNSRIVGGHIAHATLGLFDVDKAFGRQLEGSADAVAVGARANQ